MGNPPGPVCGPLAAASVLLVLAACGREADPAAGAGTAEAAAAPGLPFAETLAGTTVRFEMVYVPPGRLPAAAAADGGAAAAADGVDGAAGATVGGFWIGRTEVTWDAYDVFVFGLDEDPAAAGGGAAAFSKPSKPYITPDRGFGHAGYPALSMSSLGAVMYCVWLSNKTGRRYRLPTKEEWEYACRAGATTAYHCGDDPAGLDEIAWTRANARHKTHPVGALAANAFGLHDMHGNAAEWVTSGTGEFSVMGGSFQDRPENATATSIKPESKAWNASDPQIPKSHWWLADAPFVGMRVVCEDGPRAAPDAPTGSR